MMQCITVMFFLTSNWGSDNSASSPILCVCARVCVYVFIKLHITAQSGPVILVILCHSH